MYNETYAYFPDRNVTGPERSKPGDTRWQAAPFMAHRHYGPTYKWILLGDDDTLWFMMGVKRLLHGYDHTLPYAISDHLGDHNAAGFFVPSPMAAVCAPCHWPALLRAARMEHLLAAGSPEVSEEEAAGWNPRELDGWGVGRLRTRAANATAGGWRAAAAAAGVGAAGAEGGGGGGGGGGAAQGAGAAGGGAANARSLLSQLKAGTPARAPPQPEQDAQRPPRWPRWLQRRQGLPQLPESQLIPIRQLNTTALLHLAYYGAPAANASTAGTSAAAPPPPPSALPLSPVPPPGCPCRPPQGCLHRARVCRGVGRGQELCGRSVVWHAGFRGNRTWCRHSWAHGGAGVVLSLGLLRAMAGGPAEECARTAQLHSCDMNLAMCLMQASPGGGLMFTHPGHAALRGAHWADPRFIVFDNPVYPQVLHDPVGLLTGRVRCGRAARDAATAATAKVAMATAFQEEEDEGEGKGGELEGEEPRGSDDDVPTATAAPPPADGQARGSSRSSSGRAGESASGQAAETGHAKARRRLAEGGAKSCAQGRADSARHLLEAPEDGGIGAAAASSAKGTPRSLAAADIGNVGVQASALATGGDGAASEAGIGAQGPQGDEDHGVCEWLLRHAVSVHMHGRSYPTYDGAAAAMGTVVRQHLHLVRILRDRWHHQQLHG